MKGSLTESDFRGVPESEDDRSCPRCGVECSENYEPGKEFRGSTKPITNLAVQAEYGGEPADWVELWYCSACGAIYSIRVDNY
jgi:hypothetical protein